VNKLDGFKQTYGWLPPVFVGVKAANNVEDKSQEQQLENIGNSIDVEMAFKTLNDIEFDIVRNRIGLMPGKRFSFAEIDAMWSFKKGVAKKIYDRGIKKLRKFFRAIT